MTLTLPDSARPEFSVVMVTHGSWPLTQRALAAVVAHAERPFEVIIVDNGSEDQTRARLSELRHARIILNRENRGFGPATNQGAQRASADHLLLLNSDAFVHAGWLDPLLETLHRGAVGAVVPRYLYPDGSLQDAGVLLAQDGTVMVYGDGDDPARLCYRFRRVIDFGSAACMLIRRSVLDALGGFDELYAPAYYEDADLCLRLARQGLAVVYEPASTVTHVRYGSSHSDTAAELSDRNRRRFLKRWGSELQGRPWTLRGASGQAVIAARDALATPRVLICARADDASADQLAHALMLGWPEGRVTWATGAPLPDRFDPRPWLRIGIELVDEANPSWLEDRLFHYDLAVVGGGSALHVLAALERTQPQAPRIWLTELDGQPETLLSRLTPVLTNVGIAPAAMPQTLSI
jgi:GT2 family glycosyltransferase